MNSIAAHVEFLLRKHDCVVLPGMGALLCNYVPAHFDDDNGVALIPPGRSLAFNGLLSDSDGLLASSISRKERIPYEDAVARMSEEIEMLRRQLDGAGEIQFGRLGRFSVNDDGRLQFRPENIPSINGYFYGLSPVAPIPVSEREAWQPVGVLSADVESFRDKPRRHIVWRFYATGIAASLAVIVTLVLFLVSPIEIDHPTQMASIAPVPSATSHPDMALEADAVAFTDNIDAVDTKPIAVATSSVGNVNTVADVCSDSVVHRGDSNNVSEPEPSSLRFLDSDPYCVIVASFPTKTQANSYIGEFSQRRLGILEQDGKFRVYAATAPSYRAANEQKRLTGQLDAWVCRR